MNALRIQKEVQTRFRFRCQKCDSEIEVEAEKKAGARAIARRRGWDFQKQRHLEGASELWYCPVHWAAIQEAIRRHRARKLKVYTDEPTKTQNDDSNLIDAEKRAHGAMRSFEVGFGRVLTGDQMTACLRLRTALEIVAGAGNACMSYDGVGIDNLSYGAKSIQERVVEARTFERRCQKAVISDVQPFHVDAWKVFIAAIERDLTAEKTGELVGRMRKDKNHKRQRAHAIDIVSRSADAIKKIRY